MEIPSSSPVYTPLRPAGNELGPEDYGLEKVDLFPSAQLPESADSTFAQHTHPHEDIIETQGTQIESSVPNSPLKIAECYVADTFAEEPLTTKRTNHEPQYFVDGSQVIYDGNKYDDDDDDDDNETTIFSDDDDNNDYDNANSNNADIATSPTQEETFDTRKTTQNYLEELLTESLLESLPLPPEKKLGLRHFREPPPPTHTQN